MNYEVLSTNCDLYLNERKIASYLVPSFITEEFIGQIIEDIIRIEVVARVMEEDAIRGWKFTEEIGIGVMNPRGLTKLMLSSKMIKTP